MVRRFIMLGQKRLAQIFWPWDRVNKPHFQDILTSQKAQWDNLHRKWFHLSHITHCQNCNLNYKNSMLWFSLVPKKKWLWFNSSYCNALKGSFQLIVCWYVFMSPDKLDNWTGHHFCVWLWCLTRQPIKRRPVISIIISEWPLENAIVKEKDKKTTKIMYFSVWRLFPKI